LTFVSGANHEIVKLALSAEAPPLWPAELVGADDDPDEPLEESQLHPLSTARGEAIMTNTTANRRVDFIVFLNRRCPRHPVDIESARKERINYHLNQLNNVSLTADTPRACASACKGLKTRDFSVHCLTRSVTLLAFLGRRFANLSRCRLPSTVDGVLDED
jgi:hypothetical protein